MADTQKTTKAAREALTASQKIPVLLTREELGYCLGFSKPMVKLSDINRKFRAALGRLEND